MIRKGKINISFAIHVVRISLSKLKVALIHIIQRHWKGYCPLRAKCRKVTKVEQTMSHTIFENREKISNKQIRNKKCQLMFRFSFLKAIQVKIFLISTLK